MKYQEIIDQCNFNRENLTSGCVECNNKALDFYESVMEYMEHGYKCIDADWIKVLLEDHSQEWVLKVIDKVAKERKIK
jgi:hypothetical protein